MAKMNQVSLSSADSSKVALQAQQYAVTESELVRATAYDSLSGKAKSIISGTSYQKEVIVSSESTYDSDIKQKIVTINVYKDNEALPRCSLKIVRLNKGESDTSSVPKGAILPWYGSINSIPAGFALCNGQNGTPDLRNRFLVGAGSSYSVGSTGGANTVTLTVAQMPSHEHDMYSGRYGSNIYSISCDGSSYGGTLQDRHRTKATGGNQPHENRPPYYALFFIMKL